MSDDAGFWRAKAEVYGRELSTLRQRVAELEQQFDLALVRAMRRWREKEGDANKVLASNNARLCRDRDEWKEEAGRQAARVAELEADIRPTRELNDGLMSSIENLSADVERLTRERDEAQDLKMLHEDELALKLSKELAASRATSERLREALGICVGAIRNARKWEPNISKALKRELDDAARDGDAALAATDAKEGPKLSPARQVRAKLASRVFVDAPPDVSGDEDIDADYGLDGPDAKEGK